MRTFFPADETARNAFNAMLTSGGACYWMAIVAPNDGSTPMVFGTIPTTTMAGHTIMAGRLVDIDNIEQSIDVYKDTFAKTPSVSVEIYNADGAVNQAIMAGSTITIRMGYGATMSIATSEVFFTGKIPEIDRNELHKLKFECNGTLQKFDGEVGEVVSNAYDNDVGKIYPIVNGEWNDINSYCPIIKLSKNKSSIIYSFGKSSNGTTRPTLYYYNKITKSGSILYSTSSTTLEITEDGKILPIIDFIPMGVAISSASNLHTFIIETSLYNKIDTVNHSYKILIDNEIMAIISKSEYSSSKRIFCLRGIDNTQITTHAVGSRAYVVQIDGSIVQKGSLQVTANRSYARSVQASTVSGYKSFLLQDLISGTNPYISGIDKIYGGDSSLKIKPIPISNNYVQSERVNSITGIKWGAVIDSLGFDDTNIFSASLKYSVDLEWSSSSGLAENGAVFVLQDNTGHSVIETKLGSGTETINGTISLYQDVNGQPIDSFLDNLIIEAYVKRSPYVEIYATVYLEAAITELTLQFNLNVDMLKIDLWGRDTGRLCPISGYFNDNISTLMTNPSSIIEDFCRSSVPSMLYTDLDESSFDEFYTDRTDWKLATAIFTGMK